VAERVADRGRIRWLGPALVQDPIASKVGLGNPHDWRVMWVAYYQRKVRSGVGDSGTTAVMPALGTIFDTATLVDDASLRLGGNLSCRIRPPGRDDGNVG
jgi:hypothetical protein